MSAYFLALPIPFRFLVYPRLQRLPRVPVGPSFLRGIQPDVVILPSQGHDPLIFDVVKACRAFQVPCFMLADNWDNLSSKSILWERPDFVGVWGPQTREHAINIQGFSADKVMLLGTPRAEVYRCPRSQARPHSAATPYVLFTGTSLVFDEVSVLALLDRVAEDLLLRFGRSFHVIYRPHPWRQAPVNLRTEFKHVRPDMSLGEQFWNQGYQATEPHIPSLEDYPNLVADALFMVGGLTSMLIEAAVMYKPYIALVHEEMANPTSPRRVYDAYQHFRGIEKLSHLHLCRDLTALPRLVETLFQNPHVDDPERLDEERMHFLVCEPGDYSDRLVAAIQTICRARPGEEQCI